MQGISLSLTYYIAITICFSLRNHMSLKTNKSEHFEEL